MLDLTIYSLIILFIFNFQTATGLFGLGNAQTRCIRTYNTPLLNESVKNNPLKMARLQWPANKVVSLITDDNLEYRFSVT